MTSSVDTTTETAPKTQNDWSSEEMKEVSSPPVPSIASPEPSPNVFDPQWNRKDIIDWNELYHLTVDRGQILFVEGEIRKYFRAQNASVIMSKEDPQQMNVDDLPRSICDFIQRTLSEAAMVRESHQMLHSHQNWKTEVDNKDGISIYYRAEDAANGIHSIKARWSSKCHPVDFIAVMNEIDLIPEIITMIPIETQYLKEYSELEKTVYCKAKLWFPFNHRDAVVRVKGYDLLHEHGEVLVLGQSVSESDKGLEEIDVPQIDNKTKRLEVTMLQLVIKPMIMENGELGVDVISTYNVDFKMYLPTSLLNWFTRKFAFHSMKKMRERTENLEGTSHQQRIKENVLYSRWKTRFEQWRDVRKLNENSE